MFGLPSTTGRAFLHWLALSPPDQWTRLLDRHVGVALEKERTKRQHWEALQQQTQDDDDDGRPQQFFVRDGQLHLGAEAAYAVQLLGVEGMDCFLWAWALTDEMKQSDPTLQIPPQHICHDLRQHPALRLESDNDHDDDDDHDKDDDKENDKENDKDDTRYFPEFSTDEPIPLSLTHSGETFSVVASGVLRDTCRAIYQVPDYNTGLVCYWMVTDEAYPLESSSSSSSTAPLHAKDSAKTLKTTTTTTTTTQQQSKSVCARLSAVLQAMAHPHASHRVTSFTAALEGYAAALDMTVIRNDDGSQWTATPRQVFWGDSVLAFVDPDADKLMGISARYDGAIHTTWVVYDEFGKFAKFAPEPSLDLATGLPVDDDGSDNDEEKAKNSTETPAINGSSRGS